MSFLRTIFILFSISLVITITLPLTSSCSKDEIEEPFECTIDIDTIDFTFDIDYDNPEKYLAPGSQSDLSDEHLMVIVNDIGTPTSDMEGALKVCHWFNQTFTFENAGGAMAGVNTADELFAIRKFYGCHSLALLISSALREFGIPAVMIETAGVQWGYDQHNGTAGGMIGHVLSELYIDGKWILFDNNCTYVDNYDYTNPFVPVTFANQKGLFVVGKGVDIWDYQDGYSDFTHEKLMGFSDNIFCYEELFFTVNYSWKN
ncbi:MAG: transglutaminase-like domain-containing protein [Bacteroidota bacterium]